MKNSTLLLLALGAAGFIYWQSRRKIPAPAPTVKTLPSGSNSPLGAISDLIRQNTTKGQQWTSLLQSGLGSLSSLLGGSKSSGGGVSVGGGGGGFQGAGQRNPSNNLGDFVQNFGNQSSAPTAPSAADIAALDAAGQDNAYAPTGAFDPFAGSSIPAEPDISGYGSDYTGGYDASGNYDYGGG